MNCLKSNAELMNILERLRQGKLTSPEAATELRYLPYENMGYARIDHHRVWRMGFPEVIYCPGKTHCQIAEIAAVLAKSGRNIIATKADETVFEQVRKIIPVIQYNQIAKIMYIHQEESSRRGRIAVISAGTADQAVAEEAAVTVELMGCEARRLYDVGVAGIHRLFDSRDLLEWAQILIVVAGMDGALVSVVGGLTAKPIVAVPTSVGYGASFNGAAALLAMLNSCAMGIAVVNIDNGFGAAAAAWRLISSLDSGNEEK